MTAPNPPEERQHADRVVDDVYEEGRQEERALVVAYLKSVGMTLVADRIARGEHIGGTGADEP